MKKLAFLLIAASTIGCSKSIEKKKYVVKHYGRQDVNTLSEAPFMDIDTIEAATDSAAFVRGLVGFYSWQKQAALSADNPNIIVSAFEVLDESGHNVEPLLDEKMKERMTNTVASMSK